VISFSVTIGQTTLNDPLGQDAYGYYVFDWGDTSYPQCPAYSWVGIAPAEGGCGTALNLTDPGSSSDEGDQTSASSITLPSICPSPSSSMECSITRLPSHQMDSLLLELPLILNGGTDAFLASGSEPDDCRLLG
jgi:hypothetical protein